MKRRLISLVGVAAAAVWALCCVASEVDARGAMSVKIGKGEARVAVLDGSARVQSGQKTWQALESGSLLKGGDEVQVDSGSRMEIRLPDQSALRFSENSRFKIVSIDVSDETKTRNAKVNLALGKAWANVSKTTGTRPNYEMASRNAVCGVRGTVYRMNVEEDQSVLVRVYTGEVNVSGGGPTAGGLAPAGPPQRISGPTVVEGPRKVTLEEWTYIVKAMQQIRIGGDGAAQKPEPFTDEQDRDAWVEWNRSMDDRSDSPGEPASSGESGWFNWFRN